MRWGHTCVKRRHTIGWEIVISKIISVSMTTMTAIGVGIGIGVGIVWL